MANVLSTLIVTIGAMFIGVLALIWHFAVPVAVVVVAIKIIKEFAKEVNVKELFGKEEGDDK